MTNMWQAKEITLQRKSFLFSVLAYGGTKNEHAAELCRASHTDRVSEEYCRTAL
jgi:hypothetical protein